MGARVETMLWHDACGASRAPGGPAVPMSIRFDINGFEACPLKFRRIYLNTRVL
jgi:hypothetical protein